MSIWMEVALLVWLATVEHRLYLARKCIEALLELNRFTRKRD